MLVCSQCDAVNKGQGSWLSGQYTVHPSLCAGVSFSLRVHAFCESGSPWSIVARRQFCAVHAWLASRPAWLLPAVQHATHFATMWFVAWCCVVQRI
jgi:hypothetical protein